MMPFDARRIALAQNDRRFEPIGGVPGLAECIREMDIEVVAGTDTPQQIAVTGASDERYNWHRHRHARATLTRHLSEK